MSITSSAAKHSVRASALAASLWLLGIAQPSAALAQERAVRSSPLADAPSIRHRLEYRKSRFELGLGLGATLGQDFYHAVLIGPRIGYHINDWFAVSGSAAFNMTPNYKTSLHNLLEGVLPKMTSMKPVGDRTPYYEEAAGAMNKIGQVFGIQGELIPFTGKYALFGKFFASYDFYALGGVGFINFSASGKECVDKTPSPNCPFTGMKAGPNFGLGMHTYFNDLVALNIELRDVLVKHNPAGRDENGDMVTNSDDNRLNSNYILTFNVAFFLPSKAKTTD